MQKIGIVGSGAMGSGIAQVAAISGHPVEVFDSNPEVLGKARLQIEKSLKSQVDKGKLDLNKALEIQSRITFVGELNKLKDSNLIIEAVLESREIKQSVFTELETHVSHDCILASNTSSISITSIASACKNPERFIGIHFFNPAPVMPLVEIIPGLATSRETTSSSKALIDSWKKTTVIATDTPGFIVNRIARPFYGEAIRIYEENIADFATIDWAMKEFGGFKMGPFELMDFIGNDVNYKVTETVWEQFFYDPRYRPSLTQKRLFEAKFFGRKSGKGYYNYAENSQPPEPKRNDEVGKKIYDRVLAMLINEAVEAVYLGIATRDDIETAMTKGVNYPKGLLKWADETGIKNVLNTLKELQENYCEDRYRASLLLKKMATEEKNFF